MVQSFSRRLSSSSPCAIRCVTTVIVSRQRTSGEPAYKSDKKYVPHSDNRGQGDQSSSLNIVIRSIQNVANGSVAFCFIYVNIIGEALCRCVQRNVQFVCKKETL